MQPSHSDNSPSYSIDDLRTLVIDIANRLEKQESCVSQATKSCEGLAERIDESTKNLKTELREGKESIRKEVEQTMLHFKSINALSDGQFKAVEAQYSTLSDRVEFVREAISARHTLDSIRKELCDPMSPLPNKSDLASLKEEMHKMDSKIENMKGSLDSYLKINVAAMVITIGTVVFSCLSLVSKIDSMKQITQPFTSPPTKPSP